jgi:hypothetical protein
MASPTKGFSLVKYDTPILVSKALGKGSSTGASKNSSAVTSASSNRSKDQDATGTRTEDYLNSILPPREYQNSG